MAWFSPVEAPRDELTAVGGVPIGLELLDAMSRSVDVEELPNGWISSKLGRRKEGEAMTAFGTELLEGLAEILDYVRDKKTGARTRAVMVDAPSSGRVVDGRQRGPSTTLAL